MSSSPAVLVIGASGAIGSPLINDLGPATHISAAAGRHVPYADPGPEAIRHALLDSGVPAEFADYVSQAFSSPSLPAQ